MHGSGEYNNGHDRDGRVCICAGRALEADGITGSCFSSGLLAVGLPGLAIGGPVLVT